MFFKKVNDKNWWFKTKGGYGSIVMLPVVAGFRQHTQSGVLPQTFKQDSFDYIPTCRLHTHTCVHTHTVPSQQMPSAYQHLHLSCKW